MTRGTLPLNHTHSLQISGSHLKAETGVETRLKGQKRNNLKTRQPAWSTCWHQRAQLKDLLLVVSNVGAFVFLLKLRVLLTQDFHLLLKTIDPEKPQMKQHQNNNIREKQGEKGI